jgi:CRISPR-associated protein Csx17
MHEIALTGCTAAPFGAYLKALGVLRLVAVQADPESRGRWTGDTFTLTSILSPADLKAFFLEQYAPTPIVAPWNGGSGFYPKDNQDGIAAIERSTAVRFSDYREVIRICRSFAEVQHGKGGDEEERRTAILRQCRNRLPDRVVDWLDAAVGIAADGSRAFAPVLGTGGNEGRLDYTNNFMSRIAALLVTPDPRIPGGDLLGAALFGQRTTALQPGAAGQFDPGRAGGANQGPGVSPESATNPWDLVLTLEGAVAWASGIYRRQGTAYRSVLCSPFTVRCRAVGYSSAADKDDARAEIWMPIWRRPVRYAELRALLREGRASVQGRPASNALEFAEAACSLGVDRGIEQFVRYSLLKRRGDSYVALPAGTFPIGYRTESDLIRQFQQFLDQAGLRDSAKPAEELHRGVESAIYQALLIGGRDRMQELMAALGRLLRRLITTTEWRFPRRGLTADVWLEACGFATPEVRIAAALSSIWTPEVGSMVDYLSSADKRYAWTGVDLPARLASVLDRRMQIARALEVDSNPLGAWCSLDPGDATLFIEGSVDDALIEDLLFAFCALGWKDSDIPSVSSVEVLPVYAALKSLFLPGKIHLGPEPRRVPAVPRILPLLAAGDLAGAANLAVSRLRIAGLRPLDVPYAGGVDSRRLAASLLIPVRSGKIFASGVFHEQDLNEAYT